MTGYGVAAPFCPLHVIAGMERTACAFMLGTALQSPCNTIIIEVIIELRIDVVILSSYVKLLLGLHNGTQIHVVKCSSIEMQ